MTVLQPDLPLAGAGALRLRWPLAATLALIPAGFVLIGLVIRYFGYAASVGDESIAGFPMGMCRWDCGWYIYIAEHGYHHFPVFYRANTRSALRRLAGEVGLRVSRVGAIRHFPFYFMFSPALFRLGMLYDWLITGLRLDSLQSNWFVVMERPEDA